MSKVSKRKRTIDVLHDRKKLAIIRQYRKFRKGKNLKEPSEESETWSKDSSRNSIKDKQKSKNASVLQRAIQDYERKKLEKEEKKAIKEAVQREREEARKKYRKRKIQNSIKLSKKTRWGQPLMNVRMEMLLEKIEKEHQRC